MKPLPPHPLNVPGDYYVQNQCCTMCNVPFVVAPQLFGEVDAGDGGLHCFVKRQPETDAEHALMLEVIASAELACIRYRGRDYKRQKALIRVVPNEMDHVDPRLVPRYLFGLLKARWAILKWRLKRRRDRKIAKRNSPKSPNL